MNAFLNFAATSGTPKVRTVELVKRQHNVGYDPAQDFYRKLRDALVAFEKNRQSEEELRSLPTDLADIKKKSNFPDAIEGYLAWRRRHDVEWFAPRTGFWSYNGLDIRVNPEMGLMIDGTPHLVKLYLSAPPLPSRRADIALHLMHLACQSDAEEGAVMALLDARRSRLHTLQDVKRTSELLLKGEVANWQTMWAEV